jgi:menaquinone-dependent protoporphyrinogen oxidase
MKVLVAYATRHGATRGIAERIAQTLERRGLEVVLQPIKDVRDINSFDGFVIGSAAYMGHWLSEATRFVRGHRSALENRSVWLFSSGPVGTETVDAQGRDVIDASTPAEFAEFADLLPRDERVFFGAFDPEAEPIGMWERLGAPFLRMPAVREALPAGDFRDWAAIEEWAERIAQDVERPAAPMVTSA